MSRVFLLVSTKPADKKESGPHRMSSAPLGPPGIENPLAPLVDYFQPGIDMEFEIVAGGISYAAKRSLPRLKAAAMTMAYGSKHDMTGS